MKKILKSLLLFTLILSISIGSYFAFCAYKEKQFYNSLPENYISPTAFYSTPLSTSFEDYIPTSAIPVTLKITGIFPSSYGDYKIFSFEVIDSSFGLEKGYNLQGYVYSFVKGYEVNDTIFTYVQPMNHWAYPQNTYSLFESFFFRIENNELVPPTKIAYSLLTAAKSKKVDDVKLFLSDWITDKKAAQLQSIETTLDSYVDSFSSIVEMEQASDVIITASISDFDAPNDRIYIVNLDLKKIIKGAEFDSSISYMLTSDMNIEKGKEYMIFFKQQYGEDWGENGTLIPVARQGSVVNLDSPEIAYLLK